MKRNTIPRMLPLCFAMLLGRETFALGLGSVALESRLGRPLVARIPVTSAAGLDAENLKVSLSAGIDGVSQLALSNLQFYGITVSTELDNASGNGSIVLRSEQPLNEPFLDFVVTVRWPEGSLQRQYTVLLDLPASLPAAQQLRSVTADVPAPAPVSVSSPSTRATARLPLTDESITAGSTAYSTVRGDSLWTIAGRIRQARGGDQNTLMAQIFALNPSAFVRNNPALLKEQVALDITAARLAVAGQSQPPADQVVSALTPAPVKSASQQPEASGADVKVLRREEETEPALQDNAPAVVSSNEDVLQTTLQTLNREAIDVADNIEAMTTRLQALQQRLQSLQQEYIAMGGDVDSLNGMETSLMPIDSAADESVVAQSSMDEVQSAASLDSAAAADNNAVTADGESEGTEFAAASAGTAAALGNQAAAREGSNGDSNGTLTVGNSGGTAWLWWLLFAIVGGFVALLILRGRYRDDDQGSDFSSAGSHPNFDDVFDGLAPRVAQPVAKPPSATQPPADAFDEEQRRAMTTRPFTQPDAPSVHIEQRDLGSDHSNLSDTGPELPEVIDEMSFDAALDLDFDIDAEDFGESNFASELGELRDKIAVCTETGDLEGARSLLEKATAEYEDNHQLKFDLLEVYAQLGEVAEFESLALQLEFGGAPETLLERVDSLRDLLRQSKQARSKQA